MYIDNEYYTMEQNGNNWQKKQQPNSGTQWQQDMANCNEKQENTIGQYSW